MKNWHLWPNSPSFLNGPWYPRIQRAGRDNQQFKCSLVVGRLESPRCASLSNILPGAQEGGRGPLALRSYRLPVSALSLLRDVLHSGEISWTMGWRQTAAPFLLTASVRVTAIL